MENDSRYQMGSFMWLVELSTSSITAATYFAKETSAPEDLQQRLNEVVKILGGLFMDLERAVAYKAAETESRLN